jgi:drug/metabolite transporter (DMT)-like permease
MEIKSRAHLSGILSMVKASLAFSVMALCVKTVSRSLPSLEVVFFRSLIGTLLILAVMRAKRVSMLGKERGLMVLRGLSGFFALTLHFYTIANLPLGTAVMLNYTGPVFAAIFAVIFLKERPGAFLSAMIALSFLGVTMLVGGRIEDWNFLVFLGLLSAVFVGIVYVSIRALKRRESPLTIIFYFTAVSTVGSLAFLPFGFEWPDFREWLLLFAVGVGSFYGQLWMTIALRRAPASLVSPFSYLTPLASFIYGLVFFGEKLRPAAAAGAALIILAGSLISVRATWTKKEIPPSV